MGSFFSFGKQKRTLSKDNSSSKNTSIGIERRAAEEYRSRNIGLERREAEDYRSYRSRNTSIGLERREAEDYRSYRSRNTSSIGMETRAAEEASSYAKPSNSIPKIHQSMSIKPETEKPKPSTHHKHKYALIPDHFKTLDEVTTALRNEGLESSNLILGIDFTKSNEWTGKVSFNNRSLHNIGDTPNPYEKAISIIGKTLSPFDEDNLIPCFGFGDATTHDQQVFSFHNDLSSCHGFEEVLSCYRRIVPNLRLSGPTSFAPAVEAAMDIVEKSGGQFHVLVIVADGQVTRSVNTSDNELSPQEEKTIRSIVDASSYPLSIVLVGVGDGPWEDMRKFDDKIPAREFDNFQFVNFTEIMNKNATSSEKEAAFALAALMEIPFQYKAAVEHGILGRATGKAKKIVPRPPPVPYVPRPPPVPYVPRGPTTLGEASSFSTSTADQRDQMACPICLTNAKDLAFGCGHMTCRDCGSRISSCPICRIPINNRLRIYSG